MPTDLFVRRALLWMKCRSGKARHDHLLAQLRLPALPARARRQDARRRGPRHGAPDVQRRRTDLRRTGRGVPRSHGARTACKRNAMFPVYGLAEASLAVSFPAPGSMYKYITVDRRSLGVGATGAAGRGERPDRAQAHVRRPADSVRERQAASTTRATRSPPDTVGHLLIARRQRHARLLREPGGQRRGASPRTAGCAPAISRSEHEGELYVTGRVEGNHLRQRPELLPARPRGAAAGRAGPRARQGRRRGRAHAGRATDELVLFVLHRGDMTDFVRAGDAGRSHLVNEHAGVEVARVVPVKRIPKTTSGKLQRNALAEALRERRVRRRARGVRRRRGQRAARPGPGRGRAASSSS